MTDFGNLGGLMQMARQRMADLQREAASMRCEGRAAGGKVRVVVSGDHQVHEVHIAPDVLDDRELLEDLVRAATNDALQRVRTELGQKVRALTGGLPLPPGFLPF